MFLKYMYILKEKLWLGAISKLFILQDYSIFEIKFKMARLNKHL